MKISRRLKNNIKKILSMILLVLVICMIVGSFNNVTYAITQKRAIVIKTASELSKIDDSKYPGFKSLIKSLKEKHPNWTFTLFETDLEWSQVLLNETTAKHSRNLVPSSKTGEWLCSFCGTKAYDSGRWCCASEKAVAYYMDARNFLTTEGIFQFEALSYVEGSQTIEGIEKIIKGTFMEGEKITYINTKGKKVSLDISYAEAIMKAAKETKVSPYHLASRIRQEQGVSGSSTSGGQVNGYTGYYNLFNINASGSGESEIITNGMNYAKSQKWTDPQKSIKGGAEFLAKSYIGVGQDTLYLQKFDVDNSDGGLYYHQYMQNVMAPSSESSTIYNSYVSMGMLNSKINFIIPVYNNMPKEVSQLPTNNKVCTENVKVNATNVNVRSSASTSGSLVGTVNTENILLRIEQAINKTNGVYWDKVVLSNGTVGYISRAYIDKIDDVKTCNEIAYTTTTVNLRNGPGTSGITVVTTLSANQSVNVIEKDKYNKDGHVWYRVILTDGRQGYIASTYLSATIKNLNEQVKVVAGGGLLLRSAAGTSSSSITLISDGTIITRNEKGTILINGHYWDKVTLSNGLQGYVASTYLQLISTKEELKEIKIYKDKKQIKAESDVTVQHIIENTQSKTITAKDKNGKALKSGDLIGTGAKVKVENIEYTILKIGDINGDGKISSMDYALVKNSIMDIQKITDSTQSLVSDINSDGKISSMDYALIKNHIMDVQKIKLK